MLPVNNLLFSAHFEKKFLQGSLTQVFCNHIPCDGKISFLCIGTDRSSGDCFGPFTGTLLKQFGIDDVYGTLESPLSATNLEEVYASIPTDRFIVAIDASLGSNRDVGYLMVKKEPLLPGAAMNKELPAVGDISVMLTVNITGASNFLFLQTASFYAVWKSANILAGSITAALYRKKRKNDPGKAS